MKEVTLLPPAIIKERECHLLGPLINSSTHVYIWFMWGLKRIVTFYTGTIWAVTSSFSKKTEDPLEEIAKKRIIERF